MRQPLLLSGASTFALLLPALSPALIPLKVGTAVRHNGVKDRAEDGWTHVWTVQPFFKLKSQSVTAGAMFSGQGADPLHHTFVQV